MQKVITLEYCVRVGSKQPLGGGVNLRNYIILMKIKLWKDLNKGEELWAIAQLVKHLPSMHEALCSTPSTTETRCGHANLLPQHINQTWPCKPATSALRSAEQEGEKLKFLFSLMVNL